MLEPVLAQTGEVISAGGMSYEEHVVNGIYNVGDALWGVCGAVVLLAIVVLVGGLKVAGAIGKKERGGGGLSCPVRAQGMLGRIPRAAFGTHLPWAVLSRPCRPGAGVWLENRLGLSGRGRCAGGCAIGRSG